MTNVKTIDAERSSGDHSAGMPDRDDGGRFRPPEPTVDGSMGTMRAAKFLGLSKSEFKRRLKLGMYRPTRVDGRGWKFWSVEDLEEFRREDPRYKFTKPPSTAAATRDQPSHAYDAATCTKVFAALNSGKNPAFIVEELQVHALQVRAIHAVWLELRGGLYLSPEHLDKIGSLRLDGEWPVATGDDLVRNLVEVSRVRAPTCVGCSAAPSTWCRKCAAAALEKEVAKRASEQVAAQIKSARGR